MTTPNEIDPMDRLRAADPVHAADVPDASLARVSARIQEHIVTDTRFDPDVRPTRGPLFKAGGIALAGAFALAIAMASSFGGLVPGGAPAASDEPDSAGGGGMASCLAYDPASLPTFEIVFDGTVTAREGDQVTFTVNEGWKGADGSITLTAPDADIALTGPAPAFEVGGRYLVTAAGTNINSCGYSLDYDADSAADWAAAF